MNHLHRPLQVKSIDERGVFEGYGSVFGVEDHYREVVERGAFAKTLARWRAKGRMPALLWQHDRDKPIGVYEDMTEDEDAAVEDFDFDELELGDDDLSLDDDF